MVRLWRWTRYYWTGWCWCGVIHVDNWAFVLMMSFLRFIRNSFLIKREISLSLIFFGAVPLNSINFFSTLCVLFFLVISLILYLLRDYYALFSLKFLFISVSTLIIFATLSLLFPLFGYSFALLSTASLVFMPLPDYAFLNKFKTIQRSILFNLCHILKDAGILNFFSTLYLVVWCLPTKKFFKLVFSLFLISLFYVFISRYYFFTAIIEHKTFSIYESLLIYLSLIMGLITLYIRLMLNLSFISLNYTLYNHRELLPPHLILLFEGDNNPMPDSIPPSTTAQGAKQVVFFQKTITTYTM